MRNCEAVLYVTSLAAEASTPGPLAHVRGTGPWSTCTGYAT